MAAPFPWPHRGEARLINRSVDVWMERPHERAELRGIDRLFDELAVPEAVRLGAKIRSPLGGDENHRAARMECAEDPCEIPPGQIAVAPRREIHVDDGDSEA